MRETVTDTVTVKNEFQPEALPPQVPPETELPPGAPVGGGALPHLHGFFSAPARPLSR